MTLRSQTIKSPLLQDIESFLNSDEFINCMLEKFEINKAVRVETAYQKNLTGYNLSPHPDMRNKALTDIANIYTELTSNKENFRTHFLTFKDEYKYIAEFWKHNADVERCWVPWDWCETIKQTSQINSISIFAPGHDTLHAVDISYDHLAQQRNQLYGNLWYEEYPPVLQVITIS